MKIFDLRYLLVEHIDAKLFAVDIAIADIVHNAGKGIQPRFTRDDISFLHSIGATL
jgi:hypothetical protein